MPTDKRWGNFVPIFKSAAFPQNLQGNSSGGMKILKKGVVKKVIVDPLASFREDKLKWTQCSCYSRKRRSDFKCSFPNVFNLSLVPSL